MFAAAKCDVGKLRKTNQDSVYWSMEPVGDLPNLFIVADGMGGHLAGEHASSEAVQFFVQEVAEKSFKEDSIVKLLREGVESANRYVYKLSKQSSAWTGMGTTFVAAVIKEDTLFCVNVGDSRLYLVLVDGQGGLGLKKLTIDHSVVEELVQKGEITAEEARVHPQKNVITRAVGIEEQVSVDAFEIPLTGILRVLLCSDGLSNMVEDTELLHLLGTAVPAGQDEIESLAEQLIGRANDNGGYDNISVILIDLWKEGAQHA